MDNSEARTLLRIQLDAYRHRKYEELVMLLGKPEVIQLQGASGATYQVEVEFTGMIVPVAPFGFLDPSTMAGGARSNLSATILSWRPMEPLLESRSGYRSSRCGRLVCSRNVMAIGLKSVFPHSDE